ncbi:glutathione S-transferase family protein [Parvibaculum sp.]|uniref:glutathione S-transferase family protein n=1 Tax=Parvibaculum sp. TaxID=2024848 RepID=UPI002C437440|nr:glutathione S-transferase family protein [Parvibaculum sp.]HUD50144.1 glutathione S-transferase family protein [Parvibaculum sp.]
MNGGTYRIFGGLGSPYSMKMRAILRYRRLPHVWVQLNDRNAYEIANVKPAVIPVIQFPDGALHNDSTPLILELERRHPGERSVIPDDEGQAFLAFLLEDMADEWGTKMMFHYRWFRERDQKQMSQWLAFDRLTGRGRAEIETHAAQFAARQIGRMALVGCTAANQKLIEETAHRLLALLDAHVTEEPYLFGTRPSLADFSWMGQLSQLAIDPTPADMMRETAPFVMRWLAQLDDAGGVEGAWRDPGRPLSPAVKGLLEMAGEVYFPFLIANEEALKKGEETFSFSALGMNYEQGTFKYQVKCFSELRARFRALSDSARAGIAPVLRDAGCLDFLTRA